MHSLVAGARLNLVDQVADLVGPGRCAGCGTQGRVVCADCAASLRPARSRADPPHVDRLVAAYAYEGAARSLVLDLKLRAVRAAAAPLAAGLVDRVRRGGLVGSVVTWVPGRRRDLRSRGFDHAEQIARRLSLALGLPLRALLRRSASSADQVGLQASQRWENLAGVFVARRSSGGIVLVDDLVTTGATASVCAAALKTAGADEVEVVVACSA